MKNTNYLLFTILLTLFVSFFSFPLEAQSQSVPNLAGSSWFARIVWVDTETLSRNDTSTYTFGTKNKVEYDYVSNYQITTIQVGPKYDSNGYQIGSETRRIPSSNVKYKSGAGTYTQKNLKIRINLSEHFIDAKISRNRMKGVITNKETGERGSWEAERESKRNTRQTPKKTIDKEKLFKELLAEGKKRQSQKKYQDAILIFTNAINIKPNELEIMEIWHQRGLSSFALRNYQNAILDFDYFIKLHIEIEAEKSRAFTENRVYGLRNIDDVYYYRALAKEKLGKKAEALKDYKKSCDYLNEIAKDFNRKACKKLKQINK